MLHIRLPLLTLVFFFSMLSALAQSKEASPFKISPELDYPIISSSFLIGVLPQIFGKEISTKSSRTDYNKNDINDLDRSMLNKNCHTCSTLSDVFVVAIPSCGFAQLAKDHFEKEQMSYLKEDAVLYAETLSLTGAFGQIVRHSVKRPRPYLYNNNPNDSRRDQEDHLSFFSGHTASAFASATLFSSIVDRRLPTENFLPMKLTLYSMATLVGIGRIYSGDHFITDVLTGAVVGTTIGTIVPYMHLRTPSGKTMSFIPQYSRDQYGLWAIITF